MSVISYEDAKEATEALDQVIGGSAESLSGSYRLLALEVRRGTPKALGVTNEEWCQARGAKARRWAIPERREAVAELSADGLSTREIGDVLGVGKSTIADDRATVQNRTALEPEAAAEAELTSSGVQNRTEDELDPPTPAEKDAARKKTGAQKRKAKHAEDDAAPKLTADLHHGAFTDHAATLPDGAITLLLTDPPYGANYRSAFRWASKHEPITADETAESATAALTDALTVLQPKLAYNAHLLTFCRWREEPEFRAVIEDAGWTLRSSLVWIKNEPGMGDLAHSFGPQHERILHATRGEARMRHRESDSLTCPRVVSARHPTEKPTQLLERLIKATTNPRDLVADPFAGVASTLVAALATGRRGWGAEIDEGYHAAGRERLDDESARRARSYRRDRQAGRPLLAGEAA